MNRFFTADLHLGDPSITKYRKQFITVAEHDEFIMDTLLAKLGTRDILTIVGDGIVTLPALRKFAKFPFRKELVLGNHCLEKGVRFTDLHRVFHRVDGMRHWRGFTVIHAPIHPEHLRGRRCLHGHLHEVIIPDPRYINVSLEAANYQLIHHDALLSGEYRTYRTPE